MNQRTSKQICVVLLTVAIVVAVSTVTCAVTTTNSPWTAVMGTAGISVGVVALNSAILYYGFSWLDKADEMSN